MRLNGLTRLNTFQEMVSELTRVTQRRIGTGLRNTIVISTNNCERAKLMLMHAMLATQLDDDRVVATLNELGIRYIVQKRAEPYTDLPAAQIVAALIAHQSVRVRYAVIALLLRHPDWAAAALDAMRTLSLAEAEQLRRYYTAAVYLQRMYRPVLEIYLGKQPMLPDYFSVAMGLPPPGEYYGVSGLRELVSRLPPPIDWWGSYQHPVKMLVRMLALEKLNNGYH